jgi:hypothetical protein
MEAAQRAVKVGSGMCGKRVGAALSHATLTRLEASTAASPRRNPQTYDAEGDRAARHATKDEAVKIEDVRKAA